MIWPIFVAGAVSGGFINGFAGSGTALFALMFWLQILQPEQAVAIVVVMSSVTGLQGVWLVRTSIFAKPGRLARFLVPAWFGIPMGVFILSFLEPGTMKLAIATILLIYGGFFSFRRNLPEFDRPSPLIDGFVGFLGGIMGGASSISGALPTMWCAMRPWSKSQTRAVLQPFNVAVLALTAVAFYFQGAYTRETLTMIAVALPVAILSAQFGIAAFKRLRDEQFRRLLIAMMFFSGAALMARELL